VIPRPPAGLKATGKKLWQSVLNDYELSDAERHVLELAAIAADRMTMAQAEIDANGLLLEGRYGPRLNPAVPIERDSRAAVLAHLRALGVVNPSDLPARDSHTPGPKPKGIRR
jgi:hypothetical protein